MHRSSLNDAKRPPQPAQIGRCGPAGLFLPTRTRFGIVRLACVYRHDSSLNHEILEEFQKPGYPIFSQSTLPCDEALLVRLFDEEVRAADTRSALETQDVWHTLCLERRWRRASRRLLSRQHSA